MRLGRRLAAVLALAVLMAEALPSGLLIRAAGGVEINEKNFPDDNFRAIVEHYDQDGDGYLNSDELARQNMVLGNQGIADLTGIGYFTSLMDLDCSMNRLTSLDLSGNTKLQILECGSNELESLDVSRCSDLSGLYCEGNRLSSLDLSGNSALRVLECGNNNLAALDVTGKPDLIRLVCSGNHISFLDISGSPELNHLKKDEDVNIRTAAVSSFVNNGTGEGITVSWTNVEWTGENYHGDGDICPQTTGYTLVRTLEGSSGGTVVIENIQGTSYTDREANVAGGKYLYMVRPENGDSHWVYSAEKETVRNPFTDVETGTAAFTRIAWAYNNGIVSGTSKTTFSPGSPCTRAQFALMLYKLYGKPSVSGMECPFTDIGSLTSNNRKAIIWAYNSGIVGGTSATTFSPKNNITRVQLVLMLYKAAGSPKVSGSTPFTDIGSLSSNNRKAILWAYQNGIVGGTSATTFSPKNNCTRSQLVTMLYKYNKLLGLIPS